MTVVRKALLVRVEAKAGQEAAVEQFLSEAVELARQESGTTAWFALKWGPNSFGVFDAFGDDAGREAHLNGAIARALMANAATLLSEAPRIDRIDVLAAKLP